MDTQMDQYIALLRGINVGGKTVKMDRLKACFEGLGFSAVQTYIQSGNVLFEANAESLVALLKTLEEALLADFGFDIAVLLLTSNELAQLLTENPYAGRTLAEGERVYVTLLESVPTPQVVEALPQDPRSPDQYIIRGRAAWLLCPGGYGRTVYNNAWFEKKLKIKATTRNLETMTTLSGLRR